MTVNNKINCPCGSFVLTRNHKRHVNTKRHLEYVKLGVKRRPKTRSQDNSQYYASNKERLRLKRSRRYTPKDPINKQCQYIKMLFV